MITNNFVSHKAQQHLEGRDEQQRQVDEICASMKSLSRDPMAPRAKRPQPRGVWNEMLQAYVELR